MNDAAMTHVNAAVMCIDDIMKCIPHRYPLLLLDRVVDYQAENYLRAIKNVTVNEPFFNGHFPGRPIMPGVLLLEAMAQAGAVLSHLTNPPAAGKEHQVFFAGVDDARFKKIVIPGDQLHIHVQMTGHKRHFWKMYGEILVDGQIACSANLKSAVKEVDKREKDD